MSSIVDESLLLDCLTRTRPPNSAIAIKSCTWEPCAFHPLADLTSRRLRARVEYECDGRPSTEFLVLDVPFLADHYELFKTIGVYEAQAHIYESVLPQMERLAGASSPTPKRYATTGSGVLVLEDVSAGGYRAAAGHAAMLDFERGSRALETVATFHATSVELAARYPRIRRLKGGGANAYWTRITNAVVEAAHPLLLRALRRENVSALALRNFGGYRDRLARGDLFDRLWSEGGAPSFNVLNHGALGRRNIVFAGDEAGRPVAAKLLDYHACHWNSPAMDLVYVLMMSVDFAVFDERGDELLDSYLRVLSRTLSTFGCGSAYTRAHLEADLNASKMYQVIVLICVGYHVIVEFVSELDSDEVVSWNDDQIRKLGESERFRRWFLEWFWHFTKRGYFD